MTDKTSDCNEILEYVSQTQELKIYFTIIVTTSQLENSGRAISRAPFRKVAYGNIAEHLN